MHPAFFLWKGCQHFSCGHPARNNMHKTLLSFADREVLLPEPCQPKLTFKDPYKDQTQMMLLLHEMFSAVYDSYQEGWLSMMVPSVGRLEEFWALQKKHPAFTDRPALQANPHFRSKLVPVGLHGDGTPVIGIGKIWSRQLTTWSWNSLLGKGTTKSMQLQIWPMFDETGSSTTLKEFWAFLAGHSNGCSLGYGLQKITKGKNTPATLQQAGEQIHDWQVALEAFFGPWWAT